MTVLSPVARHQFGGAAIAATFVMPGKAENSVRIFFSRSVAVNALWHGPDRNISGEKSDTQHSWPVSKT